MLVKVLMRRQLKNGNAREVFSLIRKIRAKAMHQKGYISGETLIDHADHKITIRNRRLS